MDNIKAIIEAILFTSEKPISLDKFYSIFDETLTKEAIYETLKEMENEYSNNNLRGIKLIETANAWHFRTKQENAFWIKKLDAIKTSKLSNSALEVLAIIAYKQPITKQDIEKIRGIDSLHIVKTLLEKNLIKISGRSILPGKPLLYSTTNEFLEVFNLKNIENLPSSAEIKSMFDNNVGNSFDIQNLFNDNSSTLSNIENNEILEEAQSINKELNIDLDLVQEKVDILFEEACRKFKNQRSEFIN